MFGKQQSEIVPTRNPFTHKQWCDPLLRWKQKQKFEMANMPHSLFSKSSLICSIPQWCSWFECIYFRCVCMLSSSVWNHITRDLGRPSSRNFVMSNSTGVIQKISQVFPSFVGGKLVLFDVKFHSHFYTVIILVLTRSATGDFLRFCFSTSTCILAMGLAIARASFASACSFFCRLRKSMSSRDSESSSVVSLSE